MHSLVFFNAPETFVEQIWTDQINLFSELFRILDDENPIESG